MHKSQGNDPDITIVSRSRKILMAVSAVLIMMCLGNIYAWSIFVPELRMLYGFSTSQTQIIFGTVIAVFTLSMTFGNRLLKISGPRLMVFFSGIIFALGYTLAWISQGSFLLILLGIGVLGGIGIGLGYFIAITVPILWFPEKKGLITGFVSAGFGAGAVVMSYLVNFLYHHAFSVLQVFLFTGIFYGIVLLVSSFSFIVPKRTSADIPHVSRRVFLGDVNFYYMFTGIFIGTFSGLMVIGNLKPIGMQYSLNEAVLVNGIALLSLANFSGRLFWGWLADIFNGRMLMMISVALVGICTFLIGHLNLGIIQYLTLSFAIGFCFGASFVLYARETAHIYGTTNLGAIYPFIFLGYGLSGVAGPFTGGFLFDKFHNYYTSSALALILCFSWIFVFNVLPYLYKKLKPDYT